MSGCGADSIGCVVGVLPVYTSLAACSTRLLSSDCHGNSSSASTIDQQNALVTCDTPTSLPTSMIVTISTSTIASTMGNTTPANFATSVNHSKKSTERSAVLVAVVSLGRNGRLCAYRAAKKIPICASRINVSSR